MLVVLVNNQPGVLNRVVEPVRARGFNIESLAVGHTERPDISRMTITVRRRRLRRRADGQAALRLVDVLKVPDLTEDAASSSTSWR